MSPRQRACRPAGFSTSALWFDYDRDGLLDLFVCNYVQVVAGARRVLQPRRQAQILLHAGSVSRRHLLAVSQSRQRHLRRCDRQQRDLRQQLQISGRGHVRLRPGRLARSAGGQRHAAEQALPQSAQRKVQGCRRGCRAWRSARKAKRARAWAWTPAISKIPARTGMAITNFDNEMIGLYRAARTGHLRRYLRRRRHRTSLAQHAGLRLRVSRRRPRRHARSRRRQRPHRRDRAQHSRQRRLRAASATVSESTAAENFAMSPAKSAAASTQPKVGRGLAYGDFDRDGDLDILITTNNGPAYLYRNDQAGGNRSIRFRLIGTKSNRDAIGAVVRIYYSGQTRPASCAAAPAISRSPNCRSPSASASATRSTAPP